ncbi:MAG: hypothetical protein ACLR0F_20060 [Eisenbergiella sp.]
MILYEEGRFRDALAKAGTLREKQIPAELIPASSYSGSSGDRAYRENAGMYRERAVAHMQKAIYYLPAGGGCIEEIPDGLQQTTDAACR